MNRFKFYKKHEMEPRGNNKFFTTYIKMSNTEHNALSDYIEGVMEEVQEDIDEYQNDSEWKQPDPHFKKVNKQYYSKYDIVNDLHIQLQANKDPTESLINRFNRLFENTDYIITLEKE